MRKVYVQVLADFDREGCVMPRSFIWEDGTRYEIDRVLDIQRAASLKVGGVGLRYHVKVQGRDTYMWLEDRHLTWFMESKT